MTLTLIFAFILIELMLVAFIDYRTQKISNKWIFVNASFSIIFHFIFGALYPASLEILLFPIGFIFFGFLLYLLNVMGAGDSKFLASLFLMVPLEYHLLFFSKIVLSTIVVGVILIFLKIVKNGHLLKAYFLVQYWDGIKTTLKSRFSYAPVIFIAWIFLGIDLWS
jgi:prepilin peptidase CpaA